MDQSQGPKYVEGVGWRYETKHRQTRRHRSHNYSGVGTYEICLVVVGRKPVFGHLDGLRGEVLKSGRVGLEGETSNTGAESARDEGKVSNRKGAPVSEVYPLETVVPLAQRAWMVLSPLGEQVLQTELPKIHQFLSTSRCLASSNYARSFAPYHQDFSILAKGENSW